MQSFRGFRVHNEGGTVTARYDTLTLDDLDPGNVVIRATHSDVNFKDALAATGKGRIMKRFPMVAGIDVAGRVHSSEDSRFAPGDEVAVVGCGLGEEHDGGYAEFVRVSGDWIVPLPAALSLGESMAIGTAGFTAAMGIHQMEHNGLSPDEGSVLVSGATGGVGSMAINMLSRRGYQVVALSGKRDSETYLRELGATEVLWTDELDMGTRPLEKALWGGAVDNLGGDVLAWLTRTVKPFCSIASIGLASGVKLETTVMPFILRGVNLLGINSSYCPVALRRTVWGRLGSDLKPSKLSAITTREVDFDKLAGVFEDYIARRVIGRTIVKISD